MADLVKENMRALGHGVFNAKGVLVAAFRDESLAQYFADLMQDESITVAPLDMVPIMNINADNGKSYPVDCYITLLATPRKE